MTPQSHFRSIMTLGALVLSVSVSAIAQAQTQVVPQIVPNDAEIVHVMITANQLDIDGGKLAKAKSKNPEVKLFAEQMITDHSAVNQQTSDLAKKLGLKPQDNAASKALSKRGKDALANLKKLSGKEFDKKYVDQDVAFHMAVLTTIDQTLIPNVKNDELKGLIFEVRPTIAIHLNHAKRLQSSLNTLK